MAEYVVDFYSEHDGVRCEEVVRCRDCVHAVVSRPLNPITGVWAGVELWGCRHFKDLCEPRLVRPDGFCAWGEKGTEQPRTVKLSELFGFWREDE